MCTVQLALHTNELMTTIENLSDPRPLYAFSHPAVSKINCSLQLSMTHVDMWRAGGLESLKAISESEVMRNPCWICDGKNNLLGANFLLN